MTIETNTTIEYNLKLTEEEAKQLRELVQNTFDPNEPIVVKLFRTTLFNDLNEAISSQ